MSSEDNTIKAQHGVNAKKGLDAIVEELKEYGAIVDSEDNPEFGYPGKDAKQFKASKMITTVENEKHILYSTNSTRTDRLKSQQWNALNIKRIDEDVEYAYVVVPNEESLKGCETYRNKLRSGELYTAIDDIFTVEEFYLREKELYDMTLSDGRKHDYEGRKFEDIFCSIMNNEGNLMVFNNIGNGVGFLYHIFKKTMDAIGANSGHVQKINATTNIPQLANGQPKTDVAMTLELDGEVKTITFSLKNSDASSVSAQQSNADTIADVLDPSNSKLRTLLNEFQKAGSMKAMSSSSVQELTKELKPYRLKLDKWVYSGTGTPGATNIQCAQYLVFNKKSKKELDIEVFEIDEYCKMMEASNSETSGFGTIFGWTYPSKKRGTGITLKAKTKHIRNV